MKRRRMDDIYMIILNKHRRDHDTGPWIRLHEDFIFYDILARLPVKVLLQLRCVCKTWRRFLSSNNPSFIDLQLSRSQYGLGGIKLLVPARQSQCLLLVNLEEGMDGRVTQLLTIPKQKFNDFSISENIKGLVCFHHIVGTRTNNISCTYICNPSTRELMELPPAPDITTNDDMTMTRMHMSHHFGFDPSSKQFKVLNIQFASFNCLGRKYGVAFWIFTLGGDSWRQIYPILPFDFRYNEPAPWLFLLKNCVCLNGALHWLFKAMKVIVVFNVKKEEFHAIPLPKISMLPDAERVVLLQVDGHLVVLSLHDGVLNHDMLDMEIWTLEDYQNEVWKKDTVTIPFKDWRKWHDRPVFVVPADKDLQLEDGSQSHSHLGHILSKTPRNRIYTINNSITEIKVHQRDADQTRRILSS
ncbi:unnamed protein product [Ilex paraguariensis]|uniref:F-box domain-containing protein n=1 Tax=Ilex paraguariensis TaxID=185542 RepID=A0ABC8SKC3_9AQUA